MKPEQQIMNSILEYLAVNKIWHRRMNSGAMKGSHKGKTWFVKFGSPGMADILASPVSQDKPDGVHLMEYPVFLWIEVKAAKGKQSAAQLDFQKEVLEHGHYYLVASSIEEVAEALRAI